MKPTIRFIVEQVSSARDRNGNCYHFAHITSTTTGKRLTIVDCGRGNPKNLACRALDLEKHPNVWAAVHCVESEIPIRQWQNAVKHFKRRYEHEITLQDILALEQP